MLEVPSSILSDSNVCSDFSLIFVAVAFNTHKMEHWQREGVKGAPSASIDNMQFYELTELPTLNKETFTFPHESQ